MSLNNPSHFGKINWLPSKGRAEYYIVVFGFKKQWNGIVPGYINEMFKP